jgi:hypothetical protein
VKEVMICFDWNDRNGDFEGRHVTYTWRFDDVQLITFERNVMHAWKLVSV